MTSRKDLLPITLNNPGGLRSYVDVEYNDGYVHGMAQYRSMRDGQRALLKTIDNIYSRLERVSYADFCNAFFQRGQTDLLRVVADVKQQLDHHRSFHFEEDMRLDDVRRVVQLAEVLTRIENGEPPSTWIYKPRWLSAVTLYDLADDIGAWA